MDDDVMTLREARAIYFEENGFGDDGGYSKKWEIIKLGPVPIPIRNLPARVDAIRFHDLHHVVTGYKTDLVGEAEIGAWEIGSGCADKWLAWMINAQALLLGLFVGRAALYRAFVRGRHSKSLYAEEYTEALLDRTVGETRTRLLLDHSTPPADTSDRVAFVSWLAGSVLAHAVPLAVAIGALVWWLT